MNLRLFYVPYSQYIVFSIQYVEQWKVCGRVVIMSMIGDLRNKLRNLLRKSHVQIGIAVFLISLLSFGIGYIFGRDITPTPIVIENVINE